MDARQGTQRIIRKGLAAVAFALALLAKETAVTALLWMIICDRTLFRKRWSAIAYSSP